MKRTLSLLLAIVMVVSLLPAVHADSGPAVSSNIDDHYYVNAQRYNDTIKSTLAAEDGGYLRVESIGENLVVERYDQDMNYICGQQIPLELPVYGGVYICDDYNFVVTGQNNPNESDDVEVFRITRYSKDWEKIDYASLFGANTYIPFDAGTVRFDRSGDILYIRTAHEMYAAEDGTHHQANVFIALRISDMTVTDELSKVWNLGYGYVSHSFNQFVRVDGETLLAVDHGDYYPRSVVLIKYGKSAGSETFYGKVSYVNALNIVDSTYHYNDTGVSVGGFECSSDHYLIAGSSYDQIESTNLMNVHRNIFVTATPKDNFTDEATTINWLTSYTAEDDVTISPPHMVKLSSDRFALLWTENGALKLCFVNGKGESEGIIYDWEGALSDCVPILDGSRILWYVTNNSAPVFYEVDLTGPAFDPDVLAYGKAGDSIDWVLGTDGHLELTGTGEMYDFTSSSQPWDGYEDQILSASFSEGITSLGNYSFFSCDNLSQVSLPSTMTRMGVEAFGYCESMTAITIPDSVTELGNALFFVCTGLTEVIVPDSVTTMGRSVFRDCSALKSVRLPAGLTAIGNYLFNGCESLESIDIPKGVTSIGNYAFTGCASLTSLTIPAAVTSIGTAFYKCSSLEKFIVEPGSTSYCTDEQGALYTIDGATLVSIPGGFLGSFTIPETVTTVQEYAGSWCAGMTALTMPDSVATLGDAAFTHSGLKEVSLSNSLTTLPYCCFSTCVDLEAVEIPDSVTAIEDGVFDFCYALKQADMPPRLEILGDAFGFCSSLTSIVVPEGITALDASTFAGCSALETVQLPSTLVSMGQHSFLDCTSLRQINLPEGFTTVGPGAFIRCDSLKELTLPSTLTFLSSLSFYDSGLETVTFTGPAPTFESTNVFEGVTATVYYPAGDESWTEEVRQQYRGVLTWVAKDMHVHNWTAATCTEPSTCTICGETSGKALGHSFGAWVRTTEPGCTAEGREERICAVCGEKESRSVSAVGHDYTSVVTDPTCTADGFTTHTCSRCGDTYTDGQVPALGHDYVTVVTDPTCTEDGFTTHTCSRCGDSYTDSPVQARGHSFWSWHTTQEPTCTEPGQQQRECVSCGLVETEELPATGHSYTFVTTPPTCTEQGYVTMVCTGCGDSYIDRYTPATGHSWDEGTVIQEPTPESDGIIRYTCTVCGAAEDRIMGHEHSYTAVVTAPTCTEQGFTTYTCTGCGHVYAGDYTAALGHDPVVTPGTEPTCTEPGLSEEIHCGRCGITIQEQTVLPAAGHSYQHIPTNPTCTTPGFMTHTCTRCGDSYTDLHVDAYGHDWKGLECTRCDATRENPFSDTDPGRFYFDPVLWAVENDITQGTGAGKFSPEDTCTRGQVVTFLWRALGSPQPGDVSHSFTDVKEDAFYYTAMLWALEKGITVGTSDTTFGPDIPCDRGTVVTFLHRAKESPEPGTTRNPFIDVKEGRFYYKAVLWAVENEITAGVTDTTFVPADACTRGQVVTFLYRAFA